MFQTEYQPPPAPEIHAGVFDKRGFAGAGGRRADPAGALGDRSAEQDLCAGAEEAGLKKILWHAIMERKKLAWLYSEERREAVRKFAREYNSAEWLNKLLRGDLT